MYWSIQQQPAKHTCLVACDPGAVCKPFPGHLLGAEAFNAAAAACDALASLVDLCGDAWQAATDVQLQLLQWLLLQLQRRWVVSHCTADQLWAELQSQQAAIALCSTTLRNAVQQSCHVFKVACAGGAGASLQHSGSKRITAFHGTDFACIHSILQQGLLAASGTRLQTTGAAFGQGIYLSTDFDTAFAYTKGREAWHNSTLGRHLRCVLVCEVAEHAAVQQKGTSAHRSVAYCPHKQGLSCDLTVCLGSICSCRITML